MYYQYTGCIKKGNRILICIGVQGTLFRELTFNIFDQRDGKKDDVTMVKKTKYVV